MTHARTGLALAQRVLEEETELARTGAPEPTNWTCGRCGRDGEDGVRSYVTRQVSETKRGRRIVKTASFVGHLICPCCTFDGCPHRAVAATA